MVGALPRRRDWRICCSSCCNELLRSVSRANYGTFWLAETSKIRKMASLCRMRATCACRDTHMLRVLCRSLPLAHRTCCVGMSTCNSITRTLSSTHIRRCTRKASVIGHLLCWNERVSHAMVLCERTCMHGMPALRACTHARTHPCSACVHMRTRTRAHSNTPLARRSHAWGTHTSASAAARAHGVLPN